MINLLWLKGGACGGNTMSFLSADQPNVIELVQDFGVRIIYHPTIGLEIGEQVKEILHDCLEERIPIDLFVFEGSVVRGTLLLALYAAGLGVPFLLVAAFLPRLEGLMSWMKKHMESIEKIMGLLLWTIGLLMLTGGFSAISFWLLETFPGLAALG